MVFFTCNACGQSIRKNRVEKHWQTECPNCEVLSCMDCGKDFYGEEYAAHTSCITEAEKYQGALFKGERGGASKGDKKQQQWIQNIKALMGSRQYSPRIRGLLDKISEYPNIPRKKSKFQNFLKNSINVRDVQTLDKLWDVFTEASSQKSSNGEQYDSTAVGFTLSDTGKDVEEDDDTQSMKRKLEKDVDNDENSEGLLKKKKKKKIEDRVMDKDQTQEIVNEDEVVVKKKKRKIKEVEEINRPRKHKHKHK